MNREQINLYIKENYPNIILKNQYFLEEMVLQDFSLDFIITKLSSLEGRDAFLLYMNLYQQGNIDSINEMIKYILKNNFEYFVQDDSAIYSEEKIIKEYTRMYSSENHSVDKLKEIEILNIQKNQNFNFSNLDINYYNELIIIQKLYKEKKIKYNDIIPFVELTFELLKLHLIKIEGNYENKYNSYLNEIISHLLIGNIAPDIFYTCIKDYHKIKNLIVFSKFGNIIPKLNNLPLDILGVLKGKQIKNIYEFLVKLPVIDKLKNDYNYQDIINIIVNMTSLIDYENVDNIIKHLPNDKTKVDRLFTAFLNIDLTKVKVEDNKIIFNQDFIKMFMGDNLEEPNNLLNLIYEGKTNLNDKLEFIYSYWDLLEERYNNQHLKTKLAFLEEVLKVNQVVLNPDEYLLEEGIINSYYDNPKFQHLKNINLIEEIREEYKKMKHNYQKTIPYVKGEMDGYNFETLKANDPNLFITGTSCDCCFKIGGDADSFVKYCAHNPNGRVLTIKNKRGNIVAMVPMVRNGNLILCNSIESRLINNDEFMKKMFEILEEAGNKILQISNQAEEKENSIKAILVGSYKNDISKFEKYRAVKYGEIDDICLYPLDKTIYTNMGGFDFNNYIISSISNLNYNELRSFYPTTMYNEPRNEAIELEKEHITDKVKKLISSIAFESNNDILDFTNIEKIIFNEDWLIIIDKKYKISSYIVSKEPRAIEEYQEYLRLAEEHCNYYDEDGKLIENYYYK